MMEWGRLINQLQGVNILNCAGLDGSLVRGITHDFREVEPGFIYACLENEEYSEPHILGNGINHLHQALERGALCFLCRQVPQGFTCPVIQAEDPNRVNAQIANLIHNRPLDEMVVVGVTGTNGKTSITYILSSVFKACGRNPGVAGTLGWQSSVINQPVGLYTTPMASHLFANSRRMRDKGVDSLLLESTSHGIALGRESEVPYDAVIFTNLSHDHLDFHGDMEAYKQTKLSLFRRLQQQTRKRNPIAVINIDDPYGFEFYEAAENTRRLTCSLKGEADYRAENLKMSPSRSCFDIVVEGTQTYRVSAPLDGEFNVYNLLLAFAAAHGLGYSATDIIPGLEQSAVVPGRFERICGGPCNVIVDFAHTPDALEKALLSARSLSPDRVITVFGCGGDRDRNKRPVMGRIAGNLSEKVIVTSDNPRSEDPQEIINQILAGIAPYDLPKVTGICDRRSAISLALNIAQPGDLVLITGKGHECWQILRDGRIPFDDRIVVREIFAQMAEDKALPQFSRTGCRIVSQE